MRIFRLVFFVVVFAGWWHDIAHAQTCPSPLTACPSANYNAVNAQSISVQGVPVVAATGGQVSAATITAAQTGSTSIPLSTYVGGFGVNLSQFGAPLNGSSSDKAALVLARDAVPCGGMIDVGPGSIVLSGAAPSGGCAYPILEIFHGTQSGSSQIMSAFNDLGLAMSTSGGLTLTSGATVANQDASFTVQRTVSSIGGTAGVPQLDERLNQTISANSVDFTQDAALLKGQLLDYSSGSGNRFGIQMYVNREPIANGSANIPALFGTNFAVFDYNSTITGGATASGSLIGEEKTVNGNGPDPYNEGAGAKRLVFHVGGGCADNVSANGCTADNLWGEIGAVVSYSTSYPRDYVNYVARYDTQWATSALDFTTGRQMPGAVSIALAPYQTISYAQGYTSHQQFYDSSAATLQYYPGLLGSLPALSISDAGSLRAGFFNVDGNGNASATSLQTSSISAYTSTVVSGTVITPGEFDPEVLPTLTVEAPPAGGTAAIVSDAHYGITGIKVISDGGAGCTLGDTLTLTGGTYTTPAEIQLSGFPFGTATHASTNPTAAVYDGRVGWATIINPGAYSVPPTNAAVGLIATSSTCTTLPKVKFLWGYIASPVVAAAGVGYALSPPPRVKAVISSGGSIYQAPVFQLTMSSGLGVPVSFPTGITSTTAVSGTNTTQVATTAFVTSAVAAAEGCIPLVDGVTISSSGCYIAKLYGSISSTAATRLSLDGSNTATTSNQIVIPAGYQAILTINGGAHDPLGTVAYFPGLDSNVLRTIQTTDTGTTNIYSNSGTGTMASSTGYSQTLGVDTTTVPRSLNFTVTDANADATSWDIYALIYVNR